MVIFTSDNGFYLGEHRLGDKRSAYDESLRIPMLVRYPRLGSELKGRTIDRMALNIDVAPTFLDYAGVDVPREMQGRSWRPLFEGRDEGWRKAYFYCYFFENRYRIPTVTAVRTDTAKLIKYPGHDDWTELFDLADDPYETRNLFSDPGHAALRRAMEAEYTRQKEAVDFRIPDFADDPTKDQPKPALNDRVLDYRFDRDEGDRVVDASKFANHGTARGAPLASGRDGRKARRFDGEGVIDVPRTSSLDPAVLGWAVEATIKADQDSGVILACGGASNGYALYLDAGRPAFTVKVQNAATRVNGPESVVGDWVRLSARITADQKVELLVDGSPVATGPLRAPLRTPREATQIGADLGSQVLDGREPPQFVGLVESVRIDSGVAPLK
jgi:hypothetical protein